jgi:hypothetical protein
MLRRSKLALCLWICAIALVAMRMSGIHLHLCEDGQEAAVAVHLLDGSLHHVETDADVDHEDRDLNIFGAAIFKKDNGSADLLPLLGALFLLFVLPRARLFVPPARAIALPLGPELHFTPPLRGPPL